MRKVVRLTESDLVRIVKRVINEGRRGEGNTIWVLEEQDMVDGGYFKKVENLVNKKIIGGEWNMRLINQTVVLDFYVNGSEVFRDTAVGPNSDLLGEFGDTIKGKFKITTTRYNHPEAGPTPKYEIHIMR